jgi:hypothetical protein
MNGLMLHCGGEQVTREMVEAVPVPEATHSWRPVSYADAISFLHEQVERQLGLEVESESYGLNKGGDQMFALMTLKTDRPDNGLSIGLRQSYNKSLSLGVAVGAQVFVCDNLCFSGSAFKVIRRNTLNVWADFRYMLTEQVREALPQYNAVNAQCDAMKAIPCEKTRGYEILGVALGEGILTPNQASVAFGDWQKPRYDDFADRNVWSLYNCATEGLKKGQPGRIMDRHAAAHDFFIDIKA